MSRTDKDRPYWVRLQDDEGYLEHDHRNGKCIVEDGPPTWREFRSHWTRCKKRELVEYTCTKAEPETYHRLLFPTRRCWSLWFEYPDDPNAWPKVVYNQCLGHKRVVWHPEIPCSCDDRPETPTCGYSSKIRPHWWTSVAPPKWWVDNFDNNKSRRAVRDTLRELAKEYNANGDIENDDDVPDRRLRLPYWD